MTDISEDKKKLIAEIKAQYPDMNKRVYEVLASYSMEDLKTVKETMKHDNEQFQYRLNNQEVTIQNTKDNSLNMTITGENSETMQVYDGDKRSSMVVLGDDGDMVIQTDKEAVKTAVRFNDDVGETYIDENHISLLNRDDDGNLYKSFDLEVDGDKVKGSFDVRDDVNLSFSLDGEIENGKFTGKVKAVDNEYREEFEKSDKDDFDDKEEYKYAKSAGRVEAKFKEGEVEEFEARDFIDYAPDADHGRLVAKRDKNGDMHIRLEETGEEVLEGINTLPEEKTEPIRDYIITDLTKENNENGLSSKPTTQSEESSPINESVENENFVKPVIVKTSSINRGLYSREGTIRNIEQKSFSKCEYHCATITDTGESKKYTVIRGEDGKDVLHGAVIYQDGDGNIIKDKCKVYDHGEELNLEGRRVVYHTGINKDDMICLVDGKRVGPRINVSETDSSKIVNIDVYDCSGNLMKPTKNCVFTYAEDTISLSRANLKEDFRTALGGFPSSEESIELKEKFNNRVDERNSMQAQKDSINAINKAKMEQHLNR